MDTSDLSAAATYPVQPGAIPALVERSGRYVLRFARNAVDLDAITKLRFEVFNLEIGEGLDSAYEHCRDVDPFDAVCHHLMVSLADTGEVVGTYRMQTHAMATSGLGYYSAEEFDLRPLEALLPEAIELGRACIAREHRNQRVLFLLWRGLARYVATSAGRYFFGCCSLTGQSPARATAMREHLAREGYLHDRLRLTAQPGYRCPPGAPAVGPSEPVVIPPLMKLYLDYGARIVSSAAIDARFNTIDFLALFDVAGIAPRIRRMFFD